ncbi:MAG: isocitrate/isopropylmalate dehydrogenase family protein [Anaerolineae bacterium]
MLKLCVIEADGIGHEVVPAAVEVLKVVAPDVTTFTAEAGWDTFKRTGSPLPDETLQLAKSCGAVLFGAAASPSYPVEGYFVPIVRLRRELETYASVRPTRYLPVPTAKSGVDLIVVRENTEDLYVQHEHTEDNGRTSIGEKRITASATERIARKAYEMAVRSDRKRITIVHKASVLVQTDGLFRRIALEIAQHYPEVQTDEMLVDTAAYWMVKDPTRFDMILTSNMYGDILSDMAAAWGGGLGLAPSLNMGDGVAIAEPVHGCAPDIAGMGIANPTATILSVSMLLRYHWGRVDAADAILNAVRSVLSEGCYTSDIHSENALSTSDYTRLVCDKLMKFA